jgi:hypothetical protein
MGSRFFVSDNPQTTSSRVYPCKYYFLFPMYLTKETNRQQNAFIVCEVYLNFATGVNRIQPNFP